MHELQNSHKLFFTNKDAFAEALNGNFVSDLDIAIDPMETSLQHKMLDHWKSSNEAIETIRTAQGDVLQARNRNIATVTLVLRTDAWVRDYSV